MGGKRVHTPESRVLFCLCSMWGDPAGHDGELFCTWFPERLPFLLPLCLEDISHSRGKGLWNRDASSPGGVCEIQTPVPLMARETQASYPGGETLGGG